jgi:hypothetical protein
VFGGHPTCSNAAGATPDAATGAQSCVHVGLNTTWGYFEPAGQPNIYVFSS